MKVHYMMIDAPRYIPPKTKDNGNNNGKLPIEPKTPKTKGEKLNNHLISHLNKNQ